MASGGYRKPTQVATYSGPGSQSQRTDGNPMLQQTGGGEYGETQNIQSLAANTASGGQPAAAPAGFTPTVAPPTPLGAPSEWPDTPGTDGAAMGPGAGLGSVVSPYTLAQQDAEFFNQYMPWLIDQASRSDTPPSVKAAVRNMIASMPLK